MRWERAWHEASISVSKQNQRVKKVKYIYRVVLDPWEQRLGIPHAVRLTWE